MKKMDEYTATKVNAQNPYYKQMFKKPFFPCGATY